MEKEFIPYELALELKQLKFNEPCFGYYNITWHIQNELHFPEYGAIVDKWNTESHLVSAPTYSQAFRWFREKYDLFGVVEGKGYDHKKYYIYSINGKWHPSQPGFDNYEEAELACLKELIEITKNK
jgi:hypothetical protein